MIRKSPPQPLDVALAVGTGAAGAVVLGVLLATLSTPKDFKARVAAVQQKAERAEALLKPVRDRGPYDASALCSRDPEEQARLLRDLVSTRAATAGLALDSLETRSEPAPDLSERVTPVRLRLTVTGSYEGAVGMVALLSHERPQLFVDSLDLVPKVSNVSLSLSGRVFCGA